MLSTSPSTSLSLTKTSIVTAVSSSVVITSFFAFGASLIGRISRFAEPDTTRSSSSIMSKVKETSVSSSICGVKVHVPSPLSTRVPFPLSIMRFSTDNVSLSSSSTFDSNSSVVMMIEPPSSSIASRVTGVVAKGLSVLSALV